MVLAAGCAQPNTTASGSPGLSTSGSAAPSESVAPGPAFPGVHLPTGAEPVPGTQVDASAVPASFPREVWTEHNGTSLGFDSEQGGCFSASASVTRQTAKQVVVRFVQQDSGTAAHACPMYVRYKPTYVSLAAPLGKRTVVLQMSIVRK
jgi:hypothetical protein